MKARQRLSRSGVAGFTLIEAVVATALTAMILIALATITAQWMPNWNRGMTRVQHDEDLALGLDRFVADLAVAEFIPANRQTLKPYFTGTSRSVTFLRTALSPNAHPGLELVHFAEVSGASGPVMVRSQAPFEAAERANNREEPHFSDPVALIGAPYSISLSYAGADRIWHDTWQQESQLPRAVRLTVHDTKTREALAASTATLLHVELPADCIGAKSLDACLTSRQSGAPTPDDGRSTQSVPGQSP
jgi:general secretion pathway protein J